MISIGSGPQTVPGMMSENEVMNASGINGFTCRGDDGAINSPTHFLPVTETKWASVVLMCILRYFLVASRPHDKTQRLENLPFQVSSTLAR